MESPHVACTVQHSNTAFSVTVANYLICLWHVYVHYTYMHHDRELIALDIALSMPNTGSACHVVACLYAHEKDTCGRGTTKGYPLVINANTATLSVR